MAGRLSKSTSSPPPRVCANSTQQFSRTDAPRPTPPRQRRPKGGFSPARFGQPKRPRYKGEVSGREHPLFAKLPCKRTREHREVTSALLVGQRRIGIERSCSQDAVPVLTPLLTSLRALHAETAGNHQQRN